MSGPNTADQVGPRYDVVIDGYGYVTARAVDRAAALTYTPTFLERTNVGQAYGDDSQAFFLTESQNDWSGGEQQRFLRPTEPASKNRYWRGSGVNSTVPGQVTMRQASLSLTSGTYLASCSSGPQVDQSIYVADATTLYAFTVSGARASQGAHGLTSGPTPPFGMCSDGQNVYMANGSVRKLNTSTGSFSTFSATGSQFPVFLNNTIYAVGAGTLIQYDSGGTATTLFTWKRGEGTTATISFGRPVGFGGQLVIPVNTYQAPEAWLYDGTGVKKIAEFSRNFVLFDTCVVEGVVFFSGALMRTVSLGSNSEFKPAVYWYANGNTGLLWKAEDYAGALSAGSGYTSPYLPAMTPFNGGLVFTDLTTSRLMFYDPATASISGLSTISVSGSGLAQQHMTSTTVSLASFQNASGSGTFFPDTSGLATSPYVATSLFDFDNSLNKLLRGIKVDWEPATTGDGGTVDIAYQLNSVSGSFTSLQTGAVSGTEYTFSSGITAHTVAVRVTLNKGTSTLGPTLKRIYVRAVPLLQSYRVNQFVLDLGGTDFNPVRLRDGTDHSLTSDQMRTNLAATIQAQTPVSITDTTGTYTGILEPSGCEFDQTKPGQWYAQVKLREV